MDPQEIASQLLVEIPEAHYISVTQTAAATRGQPMRTTLGVFADFGPLVPGLHVHNAATLDDLTRGIVAELAKIRTGMQTQNEMAEAYRATPALPEGMGGDVVLDANGQALTDEDLAASEAKAQAEEKERINGVQEH